MKRSPFPIVCVLSLVLAAGAYFWRSSIEAKQLPPTSDAPMPGFGEMGNWRPASPQQRKRAAASITGQLEAFAKDDYDKAISYQSASLQKNFPSKEAFRSMMKNAYPAFTRYKKVQFGKAMASPGGEQVSIEITLTDRDNEQVKAIYVMVREENMYRVASVMGGQPMRRAPGSSRPRPPAVSA